MVFGIKGNLRRWSAQEESPAFISPGMILARTKRAYTPGGGERVRGKEEGMEEVMVEGMNVNGGQVAAMILARTKRAYTPTGPGFRVQGSGLGVEG